MRDVTICQNLGLTKVPGADHNKPYDAYALVPGTAWRLADDGRSHEIVQVRDVKRATYAWELRWIDGRTVAVFDGPDGKQYAQPVSDHPDLKKRRAKEAPAVKPAPKREGRRRTFDLIDD